VKFSNQARSNLTRVRRSLTQKRGIQKKKHKRTGAITMILDPYADCCCCSTS